MESLSRVVGDQDPTRPLELLVRRRNGWRPRLGYCVLLRRL